MRKATFAQRQWPRVTVIITAYNYAHTIECALDSVRLQNYSNLEILILDNASTDDTQDVVAPYTNDPRVRYVRNPYNIGMMPNHNKGIMLATGEYTMFLAADNILLPGAVARAVNYVENHPQIDIVYSGIYLMSKSGRIMRRREHELGAAYCGGRDELAALLAFGCDMQIEAMLIPKRIWNNHGLTDARFIAADNEVLLRFAKAGVRFGYDPEPFIGYRIHAEQQSSIVNYSTTGKQLIEHLAFVNNVLATTPAMRFRGYEYSIARTIESKRTQVQSNGFMVPHELHEQTDMLRDRVLELAATNSRETRAVKLAVIVIAGDSLYALEHSLRSLVAQSASDWTAVVISQPTVALDAFCQQIDPLGRITVVTMTAPTNESMALNTALMISPANCFAFLRAGNAFTHDHLAELERSFERPSHHVLCSRATLIMTDADLQAYRTDEAFPGQLHRNDLLVAPAIPLDAIAITREAIDRTRYFHLDVHAAAHWELLLRVSEDLPLDFIDSEVELHSILGYDDDTPTAIELISTTMRLYDRYPSDDEYVGSLRRRYLADLERAVAFRSSRGESAQERLLSYQIYSGLHAMSNAEQIFAYGVG